MNFPPCVFSCYPESEEEKLIYFDHFKKEYENLKRQYKEDFASKILPHYYIHIARDTFYCFDEKWVSYIVNDRKEYIPCCLAHEIIYAHRMRPTLKVIHFGNIIYKFTFEIYHPIEGPSTCSVHEGNVKFIKHFAKLLSCLLPIYAPILRPIEEKIYFGYTKDIANSLILFSTSHKCPFSLSIIDLLKNYQETHRPFLPQSWTYCLTEIDRFRQNINRSPNGVKSSKICFQSFIEPQKKKIDDLNICESQGPSKKPKLPSKSSPINAQ